jgi:dTDP-glucose 4,6-dehydratase
VRILITGSEGVLGSTLMTELSRRGHMPYGCDLQHSSHPYVFRADISEFRQIERVFERVRPDLVYNLAAEFGRKNGQDFYEQLWKTNCIGTRNVIELCTRFRSKLAHASSSEAYGMADTYAAGRKLEEADLDKFAPQFHNEYALTKYTNERQITMAARNQGLDAVIFRFFNVYGPPEQYNPYRSVVCMFAYKLLTGNDITVYKNSYRTHLWIGDWARTVANLSSHDVIPTSAFRDPWPGSGGTSVPVFNIGGRGVESTEHMLNLLQEIVGPQDIPSVITVLEEEKSNVASKEPDNTMAEIWLGHNPTKDFREGLTETVAYLRKIYGY